MRRFISLIALCAFIPNAARAGDLQPGRGSLESILGDFPGYSWSLGNDIAASSRRSTGIAPEYCTSVCTYDFSKSFAAGLLPANTTDFVVFASFQFFGPSVEATATCSPGCPPGGSGTFYATDWSNVPITMTGQVDLVSRVDPRIMFHYIIAGSGTARAETRLSLMDPRSSSYRLLSYDFAYDVVPEPRPAALLAFGLLAMTAASLRRQRRRRATSEEFRCAPVL